MTEKYNISPEIPAAKNERLQPKFLKSSDGNASIANEMAAKGPMGLKVRATSGSAGALFPNEGGRQGRIPLPKGRFGNKGEY